MAELRLAEQVALVTGASRGIGAVIARRLAGDGARVAVNYQASGEAAAQVVQAIADAGGEAAAMFGDVSQEGEADALVKQVVEQWGRIDILVNNAGITRDRLLLRMTPEDWDRVLEVNLRGAFLCTKYVMPHLIRRRQGRVVNISSVVGLGGQPGPGQLRRLQGRADWVHQGGGAGGGFPQHYGQRAGPPAL